MKKILAICLTVVLLISVCPMGLFTITANAATSGYYTYTVSNGEATITDVDESITGEVTIPSTLGGFPVTAIGNQAFYERSSISSVVIPEGVKSIGDEAFMWCFSLANVTIPKSLNRIGVYAFGACISLTRVDISDLKSWCEIDVYNKDCTGPLWYGGDLYVNGKKLAGDVIIPEGTTKISCTAFMDIDEITSVVIPSSVKTIDMYAFKTCDGLTTVTIPGCITNIDASVFSTCQNLNKVYFTGTENMWNSLTVGSDNTELLNSKFLFNWSGVVGDFDGDCALGESDSVYLLYNCLYGDKEYPVGQNRDFNGDGVVTARDAIYLLYHTLYGNEYPLFPEKTNPDDEGFGGWIPIG